MKIGDIYKLIAWNIINPLLLVMKKNKIYKADGYTGINLGCGLDNSQNWLGLDGGITLYFIYKIPSFFAKPLFKFFKMSNIYTFEDYIRKAKSLNLIHYELLYGIPFKNDSVPNIYSSNFLEHLFFEESKKLLKECYRVLKPNGRIRIVVPSLDLEVIKMKKAIIEYENGNYEQIQKYVTCDIVGYQDKYSNHKYMYNFIILKNILEFFGFKNVIEYKFREGEIPDVKLLDTRKECIFVEAIKA